MKAIGLYLQCVMEKTADIPKLLLAKAAPTLNIIMLTRNGSCASKTPFLELSQAL